jgi:hypothetical protein
VDVRWSAIDQVWQASGRQDFWLLFRTKNARLDEFAAAAGELNDELEESGREGLWAEAPAEAPGGLALLLTYCADREATHAWITNFADRLQARRMSGALTGSRQPRPVPWMNSRLPPALAVYAAWCVDIPATSEDAAWTSHWRVTEAPTARITAFADRWARMPSAVCELQQNIHSAVVDLDDTSRLLARAVTQTGLAAVDFHRADQEYTRHASLSPARTGVFQIVGGPQGWRQRMTDLREAMLAVAADTEQAFVRPTVRGASGVNDVDSALRLPGIGARDVRYNQHMLGRYLPDAHGIQLIRKAHLERADDLHAWDITDLGDDRYLVEARDLEPWYGEVLPDPEVLQQAREDFAGALLTPEAIAAEPPPSISKN